MSESLASRARALAAEAAASLAASGDEASLARVKSSYLGKEGSVTALLKAIPTLAPYLLPRTVADLRSAHPELKLYLREDQTDRLLDGLRSRQLDAALIALPWNTPGIETELLGDDEFLFVGPVEGRFMGSQDDWDIAAIGRYPNTKALLSLFDIEAYRDCYIHRNAACERQQVTICDG